MCNCPIHINLALVPHIATPRFSCWLLQVCLRTFSGLLLGGQSISFQEWMHSRTIPQISTNRSWKCSQLIYLSEILRHVLLPSFELQMPRVITWSHNFIGSHIFPHSLLYSPTIVFWPRLPNKLLIFKYSTQRLFLGEHKWKELVPEVVLVNRLLRMEF